MEELNNTEEEIIEESLPEGEKTKEDHHNFPTQAVLTIRAIVGIYVVYLAYQIITSDSEITPWMWGAVGLFIVAGSGLVVMSVKRFICGEYVGGKKDK
ncbi:MAG: hypothetical protein IKE35_04235 [Lachnospiraceae bacterium]|nr:hypothetical protein [Lachnospiraceae bacterium]